MTTYSINQPGINEIAEFLRNNHKDGARISNDKSSLNAWAGEAEESLENGNPAMIEISRFDSVTGNPIEFTISDAGVTIEED